MIKQPEILIKSQHDTNVPIKVILEQDCIGELIYAEVYTNGGELVGNVNIELPTVSDPFPDGMTIGAAKGTGIEVYCNFQLIEPNSEYGLVFRTFGTGVVGSYVLGIYNKNNYNFPSQCGKNDTLVAYRYLPTYSDKSIKEYVYTWSEGDGYVFVIENLGEMHQLQIGGLSYNKTYYSHNQGEGLFMIDQTKIELEEGDVITVFYYLAEQEEE